MAIIALTDEVLLEAYNLTPSPKALAAQFNMAESSIHYRLAKLRTQNLIPQTTQPNQYAKPTPIIRDLMTNETKPASTDLFEMALEQLEAEQPTPVPTPVPAPTDDVPPIVTERTVMHVQPKTDWAQKIKALIPPKKPYIARQEDNDFETAINNGFNVILQGEAGTGKTRMVQYYAEKNGLPFLRVSCDDSSQLRTVLGSLQASNGSTYYKEGIMLELIKQPSVILFDEFNCLPSSRLFFLHEILDNRKVYIQELDQSFDIHTDCKIALACNPNTARYSGTNKVNSALADRCVTIIMPELEDAFLKQFITADDRRKFFQEVNKSMATDQVRAAFSLRGATRIEKLISQGMPIKDAYKLCFLNNIRLTASDEQAKQIEQTARIAIKGWEK